MRIPIQLGADTNLSDLLYLTIDPLFFFLLDLNRDVGKYMNWKIYYYTVKRITY